MRWKLLATSGVFGAAICGCTAKFLLDDRQNRTETDDSPSVKVASAGTGDKQDTNLTLIQAQVFFRHGARTVINTIPKLEEAIYDHDILMRRLPYTDFDLSIVDIITGGVKPDSHLDKHYAKKLLRGGCIAGQLTTLGQDQCYLLGKRLHQDYIENRKLISKDYDPSTVFGRSTNIKRTIESLRCVMAGMFGAQNLQKSGPVTIYVSDTEHEVLIPNTHCCKVLEKNNHSVWFHLDDHPEYLPYRQTMEKAFGVSFKEHERLNFVSIRDDLVARKAHGLPVPPQALPLWEDIELMASKMMYCTFCGQHEEERPMIMRLASGPLMTMVLDNIQDMETHNVDAKKLYLFATHDSTLTAVLGLLDVFDDVWPPYCADLRFELFENPSKEKFLRISYMGEPMKVRGCDSTMCRLDQFKTAMKPFLIRDKEYRKICDSNILEEIDKEIREQEEGEVQTAEMKERSETPAGM